MVVGYLMVFFLLLFFLKTGKEKREGGGRGDLFRESDEDGLIRLHMI